MLKLSTITSILTIAAATCSASSRLLLDACPDSSSEPHMVPLVTHFLQGSGAKLSIDDTVMKDGVLFEFEAPLDKFTPITPYGMSPYPTFIVMWPEKLTI